MVLRLLSCRALRQLLPAATQQQAAAAADGLQQQCGRHSSMFQQLMSSMRADLQRHYSQAFQPSRLYQKQHKATAEAYVFWSLIGLNAGMTLVAKSEQPEVQRVILKHFRTSVEAVADGRLHTLLTSIVCHTSVVHCTVNLLMLALFRRTQPLTASELLVLYVLGGLAGNCTHIAWCWYDAAGHEYGLRYALNTPALLGCSGGVAAISGYKCFLEPLGLPQGIPLPLPIIFATFLYCCLYIRETEYSDYAGKFGAAALGLLAAAAAVASGRRVPAWRRPR